MENVLLHPGILKIRRRIYRVLALLQNHFPVKRSRIIFSYHAIGNDFWRFSVGEREFYRHLEHLRSQGYTPVTLSQILSFLQVGEMLPEKCFALTFDDGYRDILLVKNFLKKRNIRPTIFVLSESDQVDRAETETSRPFLSITEIQELAQEGWEIGCHSATHARFSRLTGKQKQYEIEEAKKILERKLGFSINFFSYPKGYYDQEILDWVRKAGYRAAVSMDDRLLRAGINTFALPRVGVDRTHREREFPVLFLPQSIIIRQLVKKLLKSLAVMKFFSLKSEKGV